MFRDDYSKMRLLIIGWALIWYDWGPYNRGLGHKHPQRGDRLRMGEKAATCPHISISNSSFQHREMTNISDPQLGRSDAAPRQTQ